MSKRVLLFCLLITSLFFNLGCQTNASSQTEGEDTEYSNKELPIANSGEGFSLGFFDNNQIVKERTFKLNNKESNFKKKIILGNKTSKEQEFILLIFDHAKQMTFSVDGKSKNFYIFKTKKDAYKAMNVEIKGLSDGFHSISYLILRSPNKKITNLEQSLAYSQVFSVRVNILKNINEIPTKNKLIRTNNEITNNGAISGVFLGEYNNKYKGKLIQKKSSFKYNLVYGNQWDREVDFYIVSLLNWRQINVSNKTPYIYDKLKSGQEVSVPTTMSKKQLNKDKNIIVSLFLPTPFKDLTPDSPFIDANIVSSNRIYIE
ncbi:hypothetical protein [Rummeliibacillus sp. SL167]|uniref:hypothetical protein n=1 Tax=Rummeliibacillus sp. SL167 TaxID=2579792 RepID=UPI0011B3FF47|nr:hypothetical protein [Rummeliibacillus sp. SL167]